MTKVTKKAIRPIRKRTNKLVVTSTIFSVKKIIADKMHKKLLEIDIRSWSRKPKGGLGGVRVYTKKVPTVQSTCNYFKYKY